MPSGTKPGLIDVKPGTRCKGKSTEVEAIMEKESSEIPTAYLLKWIDNEINSGFQFVALARKAYQAHRYSEGNAALAKADELHTEVSELAQESQAAQVRAVTHQLSELRSAIDWLLTGFEPGSNSKPAGSL